MMAIQGKEVSSGVAIRRKNSIAATLDPVGIEVFQTLTLDVRPRNYKHFAVCKVKSLDVAAFGRKLIGMSAAYFTEHCGSWHGLTRGFCFMVMPNCHAY